jgi:hypothetical protein
MKKSPISALKLKLRVRAETVRHLRALEASELLRLRAGLAAMTTYHPDCDTGIGCGVSQVS